MSRTTWIQPATAFLAMMCIVSQAVAADHRDGPRTTNVAGTPTGALDLNDLYVFVSPANSQNTVLVQTTGGLDVGILTPPFFFPGALYEIRVSNDGVKTDDELVFQMVYSNPDSFGRQNYTVHLLRRNSSRGRAVPLLLGRGITGQRLNAPLGIKIQAGVFDDPFFFDLAAFNKFRNAVRENKSLAERVAVFLPPNIPVNTFQQNTLAIVIEVPRLELQSASNRPNITAWHRVLTPDGKQFDRMGLPAVSAAALFDFQGNPNLADAFNDLIPAQDPALIPEAARRINLIYGLPLTGAAANGGPNATQLASVLLPDVIPFNTTNSSGFLNGRKLSDDVIDAEIALLTGGALTTGDRVPNDTAFLGQFPYLAPPVPGPRR